MTAGTVESRRTGIARRAALAIFSVLIVCALLEIGLRALYAADIKRGGDLQRRLARSRDTELGRDGDSYNMTGLVQPSPFSDIVYELKAGLEGKFRSRPLRTNSHGMRDREYATAKPPGTYRIVGLGDSVMFGWGVGQDEPYLEDLERRLNAWPGETRRFETLNFAVPGYNTAIEAAVLEHKAMRFDPDLVVIHFINNDSGAPLFMRRPRDPGSLRRSYLFELVASRIRWLRGGERELMGNRLRDLEADEREEVLDAYRYMVGGEGIAAALERVAGLVNPRGIPVIVIVGSLSDAHRALLKAQVRRHGFHLLDIAPYSDAYAERHGIGPSKAERRAAFWVGKGDHHPNADAHTIYTDGLIDALRKIGVLEAPAPAGE